MQDILRKVMFPPPCEKYNSKKSDPIWNNHGALTTKRYQKMQIICCNKINVKKNATNDQHGQN